jgi:hypothetical protein
VVSSKPTGNKLNSNGSNDRTPRPTVSARLAAKLGTSPMATPVTPRTGLLQNHLHHPKTVRSDSHSDVDPKVVVFAPMPTAVDTMAVKANPGFCRSMRMA